MIFPILINTQDLKFKSRCEKIGEYLKVPAEVIADLDSVDIETSSNYSCVFLDTRKCAINQMQGLCQIAKQIFDAAKIVLVVENKVSRDEIKSIYTSGADLIVNENDFFNYSKIDFYLNYILKNVWIPVKSGDFLPNTEIDFNIYHYIPYQQKYIPVLTTANGFLAEEKHKRIREVNELYIRREDLSLFNKYIGRGNYKTADGVLRRCRSKYLEFYDNFIQLAFQLTDESKYYSFEEGRKILEHTQTLSSDFISALSTVGDPWLVVNNLTFELEGSLSRVPVVAAYVGICALALDLKVDEAMIATLIADLGLFKISSEIFKKPINECSELNREIFKTHPISSINFVLERKLPINETIKNIVYNSHENLLGSGYPRGPKCAKDKIPVESQLIQICELLDQRMMIKPGEMRPSLNQIKQSLLQELKGKGFFSEDLIARLSSELTRLAG